MVPATASSAASESAEAGSYGNWAAPAQAPAQRWSRKRKTPVEYASYDAAAATAADPSSSGGRRSGGQPRPPAECPPEHLLPKSDEEVPPRGSRNQRGEGRPPTDRRFQPRSNGRSRRRPFGTGTMRRGILTKVSGIPAASKARSGKDRSRPRPLTPAGPLPPPGTSPVYRLFAAQLRRWRRASVGPRNGLKCRF